MKIGIGKEVKMSARTRDGQTHGRTQGDSIIICDESQIKIKNKNSK